MSKEKIIIVAGGTAGHVFPALALIEELEASTDHTVTLICDKRGERWLRNTPATLRYKVIPATQFIKSLFGFISFLLTFFKSLLVVRAIFKAEHPALVVGFGGYPAFPVLLYAWIYNIPFILHEQNSVLGRVNRFFAPKAFWIALSFPNTIGISLKDRPNISFTGNLLGRDIVTKAEKHKGPKLRKPTDRLKILVIGGSQGAEILSRIVPDAIAKLPADVQSNIEVTQQARTELVESTLQKFQQYDIQAEVSAFFDNVPDLMISHDILITRAGASTIAEITALGVPTILIPFKAAKDDHQLYNGRYLQNHNAALLLEEGEATPEQLSETIFTLAKNPEQRMQLAQNAYALGKKNGAQLLRALIVGFFR